jgi:hypothetical protein
MLASSLAALAGCGDLLGFDQNYGSQPAAAEAGDSPGSTENPATSNSADAALGDSNAAAFSTGNDGAAIGSPDGAPGAPGLADSASGAPEAGATADTGAGTSDDAGAPAAVSPLLQVYSGSTTVGADASSQTVTLPTIDPSRAFVVAGSTFDVTPPTDFEVTSQIASATEAVFTRTGGSGAPAIPIQYYVAEFQSGVQVLRGNAAMSATSISVSLPSEVDLGSSFPLITYRNTGTNWGADDFVQAKLTGTSKLSLGINLAAPDGIVEWQIVSFPGATVQSGDLAMTATDTVVTGTIPQAVSLGATWLVFSNQITNETGTTAELLVSGHVSSPTQVTFSRGAGGATQQITWYAVSFGNGTVVQSSTLTLADSVTTATATLAPVDLLKTIAVTGGVWRQGGTSVYTGAPSAGFGTYRLSLGTNAQLSVARGASGTTTQSDLDYSVIQFF